MAETTFFISLTGRVNSHNQSVNTAAPVPYATDHIMAKNSGDSRDVRFHQPITWNAKVDTLEITMDKSTTRIVNGRV